MTTPTAHDHPDWQRTVSAADIQVSTFSDPQNVGTLSYGTFLVGNLPFLYINFSVATGGARMTLRWLDEQTAISAIATYAIDVLANIPASGPVPVLAPWVEISITVDATPRTVTYQIWQTLVGGQDVRAPQGIVLISQDLVSIPNNTVTNIEANGVRWGWGYWHAQFQASTTFRIRLQQRDYTGAATLIDFVPLNTNQPGQMFTLPPRPLRLEVLQQDGVARDLLATVMYHPGPL